MTESTFKTRLTTEMEELSIKVDKLQAFLETDMAKTVQDSDLLHVQLAAMKTYLSIISRRHFNLK